MWILQLFWNLFKSLWGMIVTFFCPFTVVDDEGDPEESRGLDISNDSDSAGYQSISPATRRERSVVHHSQKSLTQGFSSFQLSQQALLLCVFYFLGYILLSVVAFSFIFEKWPISDSMYFAIVCFTSVGYGDLSPSTQAGRLFTVFFAMYGIVVLGIFLGIFGHAFGQRQADLREEQYKQPIRESVIKVFDDRRERPEHKSFLSSISEAGDDGVVVVETKKEPAKLRDQVVKMVCLETPTLAIMVGIFLIMGHVEGWSIIDSLYFATITMSSIGFGDLVLEHESMRILALFVLPLGVAVLGEILARIANLYIERKNEQQERKYFERALTLTDVKEMDVDKDGKVSLEEFLKFMLVAMGKCEKEDIDELVELFNRLDVVGNGTLGKDDLALMAKRRGSRAFANFQSSLEQEEYGSSMASVREIDNSVV